MGISGRAQKLDSKINLLPQTLTLQALSHYPEERGQCQNLGRPEHLCLTMLLILREGAAKSHEV